MNGRPLKALNQWYNKQRAQAQTRLAQGTNPCHTSRFLETITTKRKRRIMQQLHTISRRIIDLLKHEGIGTLVIGKNPFWKQEANMGKKNNQAFVQLPHARFIELLTYKAEAVGITAILTEDPYQQSQLSRPGPASHLSSARGAGHQEEHPRFSGTRFGRW